MEKTAYRLKMISKSENRVEQITNEIITRDTDNIRIEVNKFIDNIILNDKEFITISISKY